MLKINFDVEHLQQLSYERSKKWATFLEVKNKEMFSLWLIID